MKGKIIALILCTLFFVSTFAGAINVKKTNLEVSILNDENTWIKTFGGSDFDAGYDVKQVNDGGYVVVGYTVSYAVAYSDVYLLKVDKYGNKVWQRTFGGAYSETGYSVQQTSDGGYIITGESHTHGEEDHDVILIKTDENGNKLWDKKFGVGNHQYEGKEVQQTNDGGYIITGYALRFENHVGYQALLLLKTDANGNMEWEKIIGGAYDAGYSVQQTSDGGYIITGVTWSLDVGYGDAWLIKTDENGDEEWNKTYGGYDHDFGSSVRQTLDGGYIIAGGTHSYGPGENDAWLIKTDANGDEEWNKTFGDWSHDIAYSVQQTSDGGYVFTGATKSDGPGNYDVLIIKTDANGNKIWDETFGGDLGDAGYSVQQTSYGGYIITGYTHSYGAGGYDVWLIKLAEILPYRPIKPTGETNGITGETYTYSTSAEHPDEKQIKHGWDWNGDKIVDEWTDYSESGETIYTDHAWSEDGAYLIRVRAKDKDGCLSEWSEPLNVIMPRGKQQANIVFLRLLEWFMNSFPLFERLPDFI